jgi:phospholipid/cholesterol/gamma-HCH transport system substrate-binding protein
MAIRRSEKIKAAIFLVVTTVLFTGMMLTLVGTEWMQKQDRYFIKFIEEVQGIGVGSPVKFHGVPIGKVKHIQLQADMTTVVEVAMPRDTVIKRDSIARLKLESPIVGNFSINISAGSAIADRLPPNKPKVFVGTELSEIEQIKRKLWQLTTQTSETLSNMNMIFTLENAEGFASILQQIDAFLSSNTTEITTTVQTFRDTLVSVDDAITGADVDKTMLQLRDTLLSIDRAIIDADVSATMVQLRSTLDGLEAAILSANSLLVQNQREINDTLSNLRSATDSLTELLEKVNRQPALLLRGSREPQDEMWGNE